MAAAPPADPDEQVRALCQRLNAYGVDYVVFGSVAGRLYGADLLTVDVDIVPKATANNLQRLCDALNTLRPRWRVSELSEGTRIDGGRLEPRHFQAESVAVGLVTDLGFLDVVLKPRGFEAGYDALAPDAVRFDVSGVEVMVGSLDDVVRSKELMGREKDLEHLERLEQLRERGTDLERDGPSPADDIELGW